MKKTALLLLATVSPLVFDAAYAADKAKMLPAVTVTAEKGSLVTSDVAGAVAKANETPGGVDVVAAEEYQDGRAVTIKDMLDYTPGVLAQSRINEESRLSIRGSGLSRTYHLRGLNLYQDNVPVNLADGAADFQDIDPLAFRYVEVYKGANALPLGSATLGGAINFVTPTGYDTDAFGARLEYGSFNTRRAQVSSGQVIGNTDYYASLSKLLSNGYRDYSDQSTTRFSGNIGQKLRDDLETRFFFTYSDGNQQLPGNLTKAQLEANPKQANAFYKNNTWQRDPEVYRFSNKTTWRGESSEVNAGIYTQQKDLYHPIFEAIDQQNSDYGVFANTTLHTKIADYKNDFLFGTNLSTGNTESLRYVNLQGAYGAKTFDAKEEAKNATFYAENRFYPVRELALIAGTQFLYADREYTDRFLANGDQSGEKDYYGLSPKIGALWDVTPSTQLFTNLSWSYEPPTFSELEQRLPGMSGLANIDAQKATTFEIGSRGNAGPIDWDASVYHAWLRDELMMFTVAPGQDAVTNADESIHRGFELGAGAKLWEGLFTNTREQDDLKLRLAYTYSDFKFDGDRVYGDNDIPGAPKHYLRAELRYDNPLGFYIAPNVEWVPDGYYVDMTNTLESDSYALLGLKAGVDVTDSVAVFFDARNLTDESYAATTDVITAPGAFNTSVFTPGDGRAFYAGLTYKW